MRTRDRIDSFVAEFEKIWIDNFQDWRFGQLMYNFMYWLQTEKHRDLFFPEEDEMLELLNEYVNIKKEI